MNEKKGSPIAAIKGIFGSSKILFICIVYTIAVVGNVVQKFQDRIDFEGMEFFGISLSDLVGAELVGMLQTVSNVLFAISLISLMPMVLIAVGYWLIKKGAGEGNGNTRCALVALDFFKYNLLYQAFMKISLAFGALVLGLFGAISLFSAGSAGVGLLIIVAVALVVAVFLMLFRYYTNFTSMLVGVSNTLRTGVNLVTRSRMVMVFNIIAAIWIILTSLGNGIIAILAAVADALCLIFINRCFTDYENACGYADKDENAAIMERIKTEPALAKTAAALGITQITPEQAAEGVKPTLSFKGIANLLFGLSIAPIDETDLSANVSDGQTGGYGSFSGTQTGGSYTAPSGKTYGPAREAEYRVLSLFDNDVNLLDRRYTLLGSTAFGGGASCPVELRSATVVKDQVSEKKILRLAFNNASVCAIKKVCLDILPKTNVEAPICIYKNVALTFDTPAASGEDFGACFGVILPDDATCGSVKITYVEFDDGLYWDKQGAENDFVTDEKRDFDKKRLEEYEARRRAEEERKKNAENNGDHSDVPAADDTATEERNSIAPLILAILSAVSLVLGILVPYFIGKYVGAGFIKAADLNAVGAIALVINVSPFALAFSSLLTRKKSKKYGVASSWISIVVIALTTVLRLMGGVANLLTTLLVVCVVFGIIALVKKDKPLYLPLLLVVALIGIFLSAMFLFDFGASNKEPDTNNSGNASAGEPQPNGTNSTERPEEDIWEHLYYESDGEGTCYVTGCDADAPWVIAIPTHSPDGDLVIGIRGFAYCDVQEIILPQSVKYISDEAFRDCNSLRSISMPGVTDIGEYAFLNCSALERVENTDSLKYVAGYSFSDCSSLYYFDTPKNLEYIGACAFSNSGLTEFIMPDSVTFMGNYAFGYCQNLYRVRLSRGLDCISDSAFKSCTALEYVTIPGNVLTIECEAFAYCESLREVTMCSGVARIEGSAFYACYALWRVAIPSSMEYITDGAFYDCSGITSISYGGDEDMWQKFIWFQESENSWSGINDDLKNADMTYGDEYVNNEEFPIEAETWIPGETTEATADY